MSGLNWPSAAHAMVSKVFDIICTTLYMVNIEGLKELQEPSDGGLLNDRQSKTWTYQLLHSETDILGNICL